MIKIGKITIQDYPIILAPMEDVTDSPFRLLCKRNGADILYSEFVAAEALVREAQRSYDKIVYDDAERPFAVQIFGSDPAVMAEAAAIVETYKPDFLDLNFGCPVKKIVAKGGGAALLKDPQKMIEITKAVVRNVQLPVTVKTRLGWDEKDKPIVYLSEALQDAGAAAIAIHARTKSQMYVGKADWHLIGEVKKNPTMHIPVFGNGDIDSPEAAYHAKEKYKVDGLMVGRAAVGNPWIFKQIKHYLNTGDLLPEPSLEEKTEACIWFLKKSVETKGEKRGIFHLRRHYATFFKGLRDFKSTRMKLVTSNSVDDICCILNEIPQTYRRIM